MSKSFKEAGENSPILKSHTDHKNNRHIGSNVANKESSHSKMKTFNKSIDYRNDSRGEGNIFHDNYEKSSILYDKSSRSRSAKNDLMLAKNDLMLAKNSADQINQSDKRLNQPQIHKSEIINNNLTTNHKYKDQIKSEKLINSQLSGSVNRSQYNEIDKNRSNRSNISHYGNQESSNKSQRRIFNTENQKFNDRDNKSYISNDD